MKIKFIKLINNERKNPQIASKQAQIRYCDMTSVDECRYIDMYHCQIASVDLCNKDFSPCIQETVDICTGWRDNSFCSGESAEDITN